MEINPISNITPAPVSQVENDFNKKQLSLVSNDIKQKAVIDLSQNVKDYLRSASTPSPLSALADNRTKFNDFNIDVKEAYKPLSNGELVPMFDNFIKGTNNEQRFAEQQSTADKWGNGLLKFGGKTLNSVVGGTIGTVNGITQWIKDGSFQATYDNDFNNWLDDLNTKMDYSLPNYYTEQEKEANFGQSLGNANFWANDVLGGLSFTVGTLVSEGIWAYATGGGSLATAGARMGLRAGKFFGEGAALTRALNRAAQLVKAPILKTFANPNLPVGLATTMGKVGQFANLARFTYTSAGFESGVEARHFMKESRENYLDSFQELNGRLPNSNEVQEFEENLGKASNSLYGFNLAIVGSSNLLVFGKLLNISSPLKVPSKWANETFFGIGMKQGAAGELEAIAATRLQKAFSKAYSIGRVPVIEGLWEEGQQSVGNNTASNWIKSSYDPKYMGNTMDLGTAFNEGMAQTYGSKEGWKEIGIGMIIGLISGTGTNVARGRGVFAEANAASRANQQEVELRNAYSATRLIDRIHTANRVQGFTEAEEEAKRTGDVTGAELSRKSALIAHANNAYNYDYTDQAIEEVTTAVQAMDNTDLMKQYGLSSVEEAKQLKQKLIDDYKETSDSFTKHREFAEYFINSKSFSNQAEANKVKEAVAYELTLGEHSFNFSRELLGEIQKEISTRYNTNAQSLSNALEVQDILWSASRGIRRNFISKQKEVKAARRDRDALEKERLGLEKSKNSQEDNKATLNRLNAVTIDIQTKDEQIRQLNTELEGVLSAAQLQNPYNNEAEPVMTERDLENVETDLQKISGLVEDFKAISPQKGHRLEGLIKEYSKSKTAFTRYADLARQLSDPNFGLKGRRDIIRELTSEGDSTNITIEFLTGLQSSMGRTLQERADEAIENTSEFTDTVNRARMTVQEESETSPVETIEDIIRKNAYLLDYVGMEQNISKPTDEQIVEYRELVKKIRRDRNIPNEQVTRVAPDYYAKRGKKTKVTTAELVRFKELNQLMSDWRLFEGAVNDAGISIADLINQEISREQEVDAVIVQEELTPEDYVLVSTPSEALPTKNGVEFRDASIIQTYENIKVRVNGIFYEFSHMNLQTLLEKVPGEFSILMQAPTQFDENGYATKWGKPQSVTIAQAIDNQKNGGTLFTLQTTEGDVPVNITNQARIQIPINSFNAIKAGLGLDIFKQLATKNSYSDLYSANAEGQFTQMESDFIVEDGANTYLADELYQLEAGTNTFFKVNVRDSYNEKLLEDYNNGVITYDELVDLVKVYNVSGNNKVIGDLKSNKDISDPNPVFLEIRKRAAEILLNEQVAESMITIPFTAKVQHVLLGTPNITMTKTEDGVVPEARPLTVEALSAITDFGYMRNGSLVLRGQTKGVRTEFVDKVGKKANVPVVVFKQGKFFVAYPVSLIRRPANRGAEIATILTSRRLNNTQKATQINNYLVQNKLSPKDFGLFYISDENQNMFIDGQMTPELNKAIQALNNIQDVADVESWLTPEYQKSQLVDDVQITIDLTNRPLRSPKVIIDFNEAASTESQLSWYEEWVNTGTITEEKINEIANKIVAEAINADGLNALTLQENEVVFAETERVNKAIQEVYILTEEKEKEAQAEKIKKC